MHIIVLLLGLEVMLFTSFTNSLPIASSGQHVDYDKSSMDVRKRLFLESTGDLTGDAFQNDDPEDILDDNFFLVSDSSPQNPCQESFTNGGYTNGCVLPQNPSDNTRGLSTPSSLRLQPQNQPARGGTVRMPTMPAFQPNPPGNLLPMPKMVPSSIPSYGTTGDEPGYTPPTDPGERIWNTPPH